MILKDPAKFVPGDYLVSRPPDKRKGKASRQKGKASRQFAEGQREAFSQAEEGKGRAFSQS